MALTLVISGCSNLPDLPIWRQLGLYRPPVTYPSYVPEPTPTSTPYSQPTPTSTVAPTATPTPFYMETPTPTVTPTPIPTPTPHPDKVFEREWFLSRPDGTKDVWDIKVAAGGVISGQGKTTQSGTTYPYTIVGQVTGDTAKIRLTNPGGTLIGYYKLTLNRSTNYLSSDGYWDTNGLTNIPELETSPSPGPTPSLHSHEPTGWVCGTPYYGSSPVPVASCLPTPSPSPTTTAFP
jgi:hypothetical protein